jgi:GMP synthase (glutamine-hydrolysing)
MAGKKDALSGIIHVIEHWALAEPDFGRHHLIDRGFDMRVVEPWKGEALPELTGEEAGVMLMGGPQYVTALDEAPYLADEMRFAEEAMEKGVPLVGICLGSQMIAHMLGAQVGYHADGHSCFGFYELAPTDAGQALLPKTMQVLAGNAQGWDMPSDVTPLAYGEIFPNQAFQAGETTIALQFHPEVTRPILQQWQDEYGDMIGKPGTHSVERQWADFEAHDAALKAWYADFLDGWFGASAAPSCSDS